VVLAKPARAKPPQRESRASHHVRTPSPYLPSPRPSLLEGGSHIGSEYQRGCEVKGVLIELCVLIDEQEVGHEAESEVPRYTRRSAALWVDGLKVSNTLT